MPLNDYGYQPSCLSDIMPVSHYAYHQAKFQDFKTALQAFKISTCFISDSYHRQLEE